MSLQLQRPTATTSVIVQAPPLQLAGVISAGTIATQVQSTELAMIGLYCWMSEFCYQRRILKSTSFEARVLEDTASFKNYHEWISQPSSPSSSFETASQTLNQQPIFIKPGAGKGADLVLSWLEEMHRPLRKGKLLAVIVQVQEGEEGTDHVLEEHRSEIQYGDNELHFMSSETASNALSVKTIRNKIREYGWEFMNFGMKAPRLPEKKHVRMIMVLRDNSEIPTGFAPAASMEPRFPHTSEWQPTTMAPVELLLSHHKIKTLITCLNYFGSEGIAQIPQGLPYQSARQPVSSQSEKEMSIRDAIRQLGTPVYPRTQTTLTGSSPQRSSSRFRSGTLDALIPKDLAPLAVPITSTTITNPDLHVSSSMLTRNAGKARLYQKFPDANDFMYIPKLDLPRLRQIDDNIVHDRLPWTMQGLPEHQTPNLSSSIGLSSPGGLVP